MSACPKHYVRTGIKLITQRTIIGPEKTKKDVPRENSGVLNFEVLLAKPSYVEF